VKPWTATEGPYFTDTSTKASDVIEMLLDENVKQ